MPSDVVLLTGASGLLGTWLRRVAPPGRTVVAVAHRRSLANVPTVRVDLRDAAAVKAAFQRSQPSLVIHAAYAKDHTSIVEATANVADAAADVGASTVFVSTDAVFSGDGTPRGEDAVPDPSWDYGRWKAKAEEIVSTRTDDGAILRLPLIVSVDPDDHVVQRIRSAAARGETTNWFSDETRQPASAAELAPAIWQIVSLDPAHRMGVWHLPGPERLSRAEIARRVVTRLGLDDDAVRNERSHEHLQRPRHLHLRDDRAREAIGWSPAPVLV